MDATRKPLGRAARFSLLVVMLAAWIVLTCVLGQGLYDSWPAAQSRSAFDGLFPMVFAGCILLELALCAMSIAAWRHVSQPRVRSPLRGMLTITAIAWSFSIGSMVLIHWLSNTPKNF
jgi:hypothetical protein